jgi:hypothetical protein
MPTAPVIAAAGGEASPGADLENGPAKPPRMPRIREVPVTVVGRRVNVGVKETVELDFPGLGWVYLGGDGAEPLLSYVAREQRPFDTQVGGYQTLFTLETQQPGRTLVRFYKEDRISGKGRNEWLEVIIKSNE